MSAIGKGPVGWGMIGCNGWASQGPGPALLAADGAKLVSVLSRDPAGARSSLREMTGWHLANRYAGAPLALKLRYSGLGRRLQPLRKLGRLGAWRVGVQTDIDRFLADPRVGAVWVVSPPYLHLGHVEAALDAGKHVLCEKPLATTAADARAAADSARRAGRTLAVGYQLRQHPIHKSLREDCLAGRFGRIRSFRGVMHFRHPDPRPWHRRNDQSGGWAVCEAGTHLVDLALWFLEGSGGVADVSGELSNDACQFESDDRAVVTIRFGDGAVATLDVSAAETPRFAFEVEGTEGAFSCENTLFGEAGSLTVRQKGGEPVTSEVPAVDLHRLQVESFCRALRGDPAAVVVAAGDGVRNLEVIERARGW